MYSHTLVDLVNPAVFLLSVITGVLYEMSINIWEIHRNDSCEFIYSMHTICRKKTYTNLQKYSKTNLFVAMLLYLTYDYSCEIMLKF